MSLAISTSFPRNSRIAEVYAGSSDFRAALENPLVSHEAKQAVIRSISDKLSLGAAARNTVLLLLDLTRVRAIPAIAEELRRMSDERGGLVRAESSRRRFD